MIHAGFLIENPLTGSRTKVVEGDQETGGRGWLLEVTCLPGARPDIPEHVHMTWTETFEILQGTAHYKINGAQKTARAGETLTLPPGQLHVHPWNAGEGEMVYRQRSDFGAATPDAVQEVLGVFATIAGLARAGKVDKRGFPSNPLQLAVTIRTLGKYGGYDASIPVGVQRLLGGTLGRVAEWLGYRGVDPRYVQAQ
jgi:hypothetical protein